MNPRERAAEFAITAAWVIVAVYALFAALWCRTASLLLFLGVGAPAAVVFNIAVRQWQFWAAVELSMPWQRALDRYELRGRQLPASMVRTFLVLYVGILGFFPFMMVIIVPFLIAAELGAPDATLPLALAVDLLLPVPLARAALRTRFFTTAAALMADLDRWKAQRRANRVPRDSADPDADQMHR